MMFYLSDSLNYFDVCNKIYAGNIKVLCTMIISDFQMIYPIVV